MDVLSQVVEEVHQGVVLYRGVTSAVDTEQPVVVATDNGDVVRGLKRAVGTHEGDRSTLRGPVEPGDLEGFSGGSALGDEGAQLGGEGVHRVAVLAVLAIDHGAGAVSSVSSGNGVEAFLHGRSEVGVNIRVDKGDAALRGVVYLITNKLNFCNALAV